MRTVSFSEPRLQNVLNQRFVNTFTSTEGDRTSGQSIWHRPTDPAGTCVRGNGRQNVQILFLTPDGEIMHAASGYQSSEDLWQEAEFAFDLFTKLKTRTGNSRADLVAQVHRDRLADSSHQPNWMTSGISGNAGGNLLGNMKGNGLTSNGGIATRNSPAPNVGADLFSQMIQMETRRDQQFLIDHPLVPYQQFERDPTRLVGNGNSFFASSSSGN